ncbi:MAG TPA: BNR-4 repeat-containing protein [Opitutaceae bacterium]|nr:BNR-4 repeat-containing protein [Opitutaceae bacterium]
MRSTWAMAAAGILAVGAQPECAAGGPAGDLIVFNDNGAWCWYQDERVVVDRANGTILAASVAAGEGANGADRAGDVDVASYDLSSGRTSRFVLHHHLLAQDDHNTPALLIRPDGRYLAVYSKHNSEKLTYWRASVRPHDAGEWLPERAFDWTPHLAAADAADNVTYSNVFYLSAEKRAYNFARAVNRDPSILVSADQGDSWSYGGKLLTEPRLGYVNGYTKYASNGIDRVDFIATEHHPRDFNNSVYHGYVRDGRLHKSDGTVVHDNVFGGGGVSQTRLTKVFSAGSVWNGETMTHAWTMDLHTDGAGRPVCLLSCRANDEPDNTNYLDHRFFYARFDGSAWHVHQLAKAGACLWPAEQDYTGLAALNPNNPNEVYASTAIDPRDGAALKVHEIFKGVTSDAGATWSWTPVTWDSPVDNLRPTVAIWDAGDTALLWLRGTMSRSQHYNCAIVGVIWRR